MLQRDVTDKPVPPAPEPLNTGEPFGGAFYPEGGEKVMLAANPLGEAIKLLAKKTSPLAIDASQRALEQADKIVAGAKPAAALGKYAVNINLDNLTDPNGINWLIDSVAKEMPAQVDMARRGVRTHADTVEAAQAAFRNDEGFILRRATGEAMNAEQITATRFVLSTLRDRTAQLAQAVVGGKASPEQLLDFRRSLSQMAAVQLQLHGMAAEAGRALNAFRYQVTPGLLELDDAAAKVSPPASAPPLGGTSPSATPGAGGELPGPPTPKEMGRGRSKSPTPDAQAANTQDLLDQVRLAGGDKGIVAMAEAFLQLPTPASQNAFARESVRRDPWEMAGELFYNFVLSGPATHVVNMTGNVTTLGMQTSERAMAAAWGKLFGFVGMKEGVRAGEAASMMQAYWDSLGDAWKLANFAFRHGESVGANTNYRLPMSMRDIWLKTTPQEAATLAQGTTASGFSKAATGRDPAITGENVLNTATDAVNAVSRKALGRDVLDPVVLGKRGALGRMTDLLSMTIDLGGGVLRTPTRALGAEDQFFKTLAFRGEARARAYREGMQSGLSGKQLQDYVDEAVNFLTPADEKAAEAFARTVTMSESLSSRAGLGMQMVGSSRFGYLFAPFVRVTTNILDYSTQRAAFPLRPRWWGELFSGDPVKRDLAMAKASTGALMWMTAIGAASTGKDADPDAPILITGAAPRIPAGGEKASMQTDPAWLKAGYREYSVRLGGRDGEWISYNRFDPAGQMLGIAADVVNLIDDMDETSKEEFAVALITAIGNNVVNKNYMASIAEGMEVFTSYDTGMWAKWLRGKAASFVVPNAVSQIVQAQDPYLRKVVSVAEEIRKRSSFEGSRSLPKQRDIAGHPIRKEWLFGSRFTGVPAGEHKPDVVAEELLRLEMRFARPDKKMDGIELDERQYDRYQQLAGHAVKMPQRSLMYGPVVTMENGQKKPLLLDMSGLGMWPALQKLVAMPEYKAATDGTDPPGQKAWMIAKVQQAYRKLAQDRMYAEFPELTEKALQVQYKRATAMGTPPDIASRGVEVERSMFGRRADAAKDYEVDENDGQ